MKEKPTFLTTSQFAKLHEVNKRTLHYYDEIDLFSPWEKSENQYRYYDSRQSIDFEYIRMLKELNMSIGEIKKYVQNPNPSDFIKIAGQKIEEIEKQITHLRKTKEILQQKKQFIELCENIFNEEIRLVECEEEHFYVTPFSFSENDLSHIFSYIKNVWGIEQCRMGIGSYIDLEKVRRKDFEYYDGFFTPTPQNISTEHTLLKPKGTYLCGYLKGSWDNLPHLYEKMIAFADENSLTLKGYAFELGLNDFVISSKDDYITQVMIRAE